MASFKHFAKTLYDPLWLYDKLQFLPPTLIKEEENIPKHDIKRAMRGKEDPHREESSFSSSYIVKKYHNTSKDMEDLISIGTIGLIKAIATMMMTRVLGWLPTPRDVSKRNFDDHPFQQED